MGIVDFGLGQRAKSESCQCIDPALDGYGGARAGAAGTDFGEKRVHDCVIGGAVAVVDASELAGDEGAHVEFRGLVVQAEVLEGGKDVGELRGVGGGEVVVEVYDVFRCVVGFELVVDNDAEGATCTTERPEEVWVFGGGGCHDSTVGQNDRHGDDLVEGETVGT